MKNQKDKQRKPMLLSIIRKQELWKLKLLFKQESTVTKRSKKVLKIMQQSNKLKKPREKKQKKKSTKSFWNDAIQRHKLKKLGENKQKNEIGKVKVYHET